MSRLEIKARDTGGVLREGECASRPSDEKDRAPLKNARLIVGNERFVKLDCKIIRM